MLDYKFQDEAIESASKILRNGKNALLIAPTGAGKSAIAIKAVKKHLINGELHREKHGHKKGFKPFKALIVIDREPLIDQFYDSTIKFGSTKLYHKTGILAGTSTSKPEVLDNSDLIIAMAQTLESRESLPWVPTLVFWDEAHSTMFREVFPLVNRLAPNAKHIGLTATPWRMDGEQFPDNFEWVQVETARSLINQGYLCDYQDIWLSNISIASSTSANQDYTDTEVEKIVDVAPPAKVWEEWQAYRDKPTIAFIPNKKIGKIYAEYFESQGQQCCVIEDNTPKGQRKKAYERFRNGEIVLFSVSVLAVGFDEPCATVALMLRPTKSIALFIQMLGRVLRLHKGKELAYFLFFGGIDPEMPLPKDITDWRLLNQIETKECPHCGEENLKHALICSNCGEEFTKAERISRSLEEYLELDQDSLFELTRQRLLEMKDNRRMIAARFADPNNPREFYRAWLQKAFFTDSLPGMAYVKFKSQFGGNVHIRQDWHYHAVFGENPVFEDCLTYYVYLKTLQYVKSKDEAWLWKNMNNEFVSIPQDWLNAIIAIFNDKMTIAS